MKRFLSLAILALSLAAVVPSFALADDPLSSIKADIAQLQSDVQVKHDTVLADARTLKDDATSLVGSDKASAKATIKADAQKLSGDWQSLLSTCLSDRAKLQADITAAHAAGIKPSEIHPLVREANLQIRASNLEMRSGVASAHAAVYALRQSFKAAGETAPLVTTPPSSPTGGAPVTG